MNCKTCLPSACPVLVDGKVDKCPLVTAEDMPEMNIL